jgi:hypothetical protein
MDISIGISKKFKSEVPLSLEDVKLLRDANMELRRLFERAGGRASFDARYLPPKHS